MAGKQSSCVEMFQPPLSLRRSTTLTKAHAGGLCTLSMQDRIGQFLTYISFPFRSKNKALSESAQLHNFQKYSPFH